MAVYDLEEQDQLEDLKAWWRRWGNIITAAVLAICIAIIAVQGWRWWKHRQAEHAGVIYAALMTGVRANDLPKTRDATAQLTTRYSGTTYATSGAFLLARMLFDTGDKAGAATQLQWIIDNGEPAMRQIARFRLAEVQLDEKQYDDALRTLDVKHDDVFDGIYADLRGDVLTAAGRAPDARAAYQIAVARLDAKSPYRGYVQVKLDALGGPVAALDAVAPSSAANGAAATGAAAIGAAPSAPIVSTPAPSAPAPSTPAPSTPASSASASNTPASGTPVPSTPASTAAPMSVPATAPAK